MLAYWVLWLLHIDFSWFIFYFMYMNVFACVYVNVPVSYSVCGD